METVHFLRELGVDGSIGFWQGEINIQSRALQRGYEQDRVRVMQISLARFWIRDVLGII
jgi:hypothetical protein